MRTMQMSCVLGLAVAVLINHVAAQTCSAEENHPSSCSKSHTVSQGMDQPWHSGDKLQRALLDFHLYHASFPRKAIAEAQRLHVSIIDTIRKELQKNKVALQVEYAGSSYEGIKVPSTDIEFDVMVILAGGNDITIREIKGVPLYRELSSESASEPLSKITEGCILVPKKAAQYFFSQLQLVINQHSNLKKVIRLKMHGPAVQMDVYRDHSMTKLFYSVDMVPSFQVPSGGRYYVAKPFKDDGAEEQTLKTWRLSFSLDEKAKIKNIDAGNKCRKQCMRMLKVLRDREAGLRALNSYIIKTAVLSLDQEYNLDWSQPFLGRRFIDVLKFLAKALEEGRLAHFYVGSFNLLGRLSQVHRDNMKFRLRELVRSEQQLLAALRN